MPNRRLIETTVREELKFGWEVLNEQNTNCASLSVTHKHFWDEIFLPVMKKRDILKFKQRGKLGKKCLSNKKVEGGSMTGCGNSLHFL